MKRSRIFITVLLSLFMFQSMWNVAAAFCTHENTPTAQKTFHFGHHISTNIHQNESKSTQSSENITNFQQAQDDDHSDHLPSFAHIMLIEYRSVVQSHISIFTQYSPHFDWQNFYQSPHLAFLSPPPDLTPLQVG